MLLSTLWQYDASFQEQLSLLLFEGGMRAMLGFVMSFFSFPVAK